jgi:plasmid maintenance system antidote protein VapI
MLQNAKIYDSTQISALAVAPGVGLQMEIELRELDLDRFAASIDLSIEGLQSLFTGELVLSDAIAQALARELGIPAQLWLDLEREFRNHPNRLMGEQQNEGSGLDFDALIRKGDNKQLSITALPEEMQVIEHWLASQPNAAQAVANLIYHEALRSQSK